MGENRRTARTDRDPTSNQQRLTVHDAARQLGISEDAVRMRIKRGTLSADKEGGRLYVLLDIEPTTDRTDELIEELKGRVHSLEYQLDQEREANRENRRIIVALTSRIPAIEAPSEAAERVEEASEGAEPRPATGDAQEGVQRPQERSWWRRWFGG